MSIRSKKIVMGTGGILLGFIALASVASVSGFGPSLYDLANNVQQLIKGPEGVPSNSGDVRCDRSATSTDCAGSVANQKDNTHPSPSAESYTEFASTGQAGKIDKNVTVDNRLESVSFCDKKYKTRQVFVNRVDVVRRIAKLASKNQIGTGASGIPIGEGICTAMPENENYTKGVLKVSDIKKVDVRHGQLSPNNAYVFSIAAMEFAVDAETGTIYLVGAYDGTLTEVGALN